MTHDPDHDDRDAGPVPPMPGHAPEREVLTGPGGAERDGRAHRLWRRRSGRTRVVIAATAVGVLALGGTVAYAATSGSPGGDALPAAGSASPSGSPSPGGPGFRHGGGPWFGLGGDAVHGEATVKDRDTGKWVVRIWQRGTVTKADGDRITVRSEDGTRWTWTVGSGATRQGAALKTGDSAYLIGTRSGDGTRTAVRALTGIPDRRGPDGFRGRGPWGDGHGDRGPAPSPSTSGATT